MDRVRSAGQRFGVTVSSGQLYRGFRLNGVYRGGQVNSDSANKQCVFYRSSYPVLSYVNRNLGFRTV